MRILQFMPEFGIAGAETMCENLSTELKKKGHVVSVVSLYTYESAITKRLKEKGINIIFLDKKPGLDFSLIFKIRNVIKNCHPDVIHTHRYVAQYVIPASLGLHIKVKIHTVHNIAKEENNAMARKLNKFFFRFYGLVPVALTQLIKETIVEEYGIKRSAIPVIFNGVPLENCIKKSSYNIGKTINILHIGRYSEQKNHLEMIKAVVNLHHSYSNITLHLWGDGPLKERVSECIASYNAASYIFEHGLCDSPYQQFNSADIFLLPSKYEGMPMTLIEAMGTALPIVASNVGGIPDMIKDGKSGLLCNPIAEDIAQKLEKLIIDQSLREQLGRTALLRANDFTSLTMTEEYLKLYSAKMRR